eukprot:GHVN01036210.1.p1 GENE.GHVN01036210.1~~GHVN01036210.1.p1  ORF type:complete len:154 (-),score=27.22 GHVN01036210.1:69-530(-)
MELASSIFEESFKGCQPSAGSSSVNQLLLIVSDGRFNKQRVEKWVHHLVSHRVIPLLVIVDSTPRTFEAHSGGKDHDKSGASCACFPSGQPGAHRSSVFDLEEITFDKNTGKMKRSKFLDSFPFPYYVVVRQIEEMSDVVADSIRQWFEWMNG